MISKPQEHVFLSMQMPPDWTGRYSDKWLSQQAISFRHFLLESMPTTVNEKNPFNKKVISISSSCKKNVYRTIEVNIYLFLAASSWNYFDCDEWASREHYRIPIDQVTGDHFFFQEAEKQRETWIFFPYIQSREITCNNFPSKNE